MNPRDNDGPFPQSTFPSSVFPRRIFPWMSSDYEDDPKTETSEQIRKKTTMSLNNDSLRNR